MGSFFSILGYFSYYDYSKRILIFGLDSSGKSSYFGKCINNYTQYEEISPVRNLLLNQKKILK